MYGFDKFVFNRDIFAKGISCLLNVRSDCNDFQRVRLEFIAKISII